MQGFSLETLPPGGTYQVKIEIQHPGNTWTKPYIARTDVSITVPASGGSAVVSQSEKITPVTPQIRAFTAPAINLSNRAVINREYDRWGNLTYRKAARNFGPVMATAAKRTIASVHEIAELGELDPESIVTPGIFVSKIVKIERVATQAGGFKK